MTPINRSVSSVRIALIGLFGFVAVSPAAAQDYTWEPGIITAAWSSPSNWSDRGGFPSTNADTATIDGVNTIDPVLDLNETIGALSLFAGGEANNGDGTTNFTFAVDAGGGRSGLTFIDGVGSVLTVYPDANASLRDFDTDDLTISNGGMLRIMGGEVHVDDFMQINAGSEVSGFGELVMTSQAGGTNPRNDGELTAEGGVLTFSAPGLQFNADGLFGGGQLRAAADSTLLIDADISSPFQGRVVVNGDAEVRFNSPWTLAGTGSELLFSTGIGNVRGTLGGATATIGGLVQVFGDAPGWFDAPTVFLPSAQLQLSGAFSHYHFAADATFEGPDSIMGLGLISVGDSVEVSIGSGSGSFDPDASAGPMTYEVGRGGRIFVDAGSVEPFNGTIVLNDGRMDLRHQGVWEIRGDVVMNDVPGDSSFPVFKTNDAVVSGSISVTGDQAFLTDALQGSSLTFAETAQIDVDGGELGLGAIRHNLGGTWTGDGVVRFSTPEVVVASPTQVNMPDGRFDFGDLAGSIIRIEAPAELNVNEIGSGSTITSPVEIDALAGLEVNMTSLPSWTLDNALTVTGNPSTIDRLAGSPVTITGLVDIAGGGIASAPITAHDQFLVRDGAVFDLAGGDEATPNVINDAQIIGTLRVSGWSKMRSTSAFTPGFLRTEPGGTVEATGSLFANVVNLGTLRIVDDFVGVESYSQGMDGTLEIVLGDSLTRLDSEADVNLAGHLSVTLDSGYQPQAGSTIPFIVAEGMRLGFFDSLSLPPHATIDYTSDAVLVTFPCAADTNGDGQVSPADFNAWILAFNSGAPACDQNGDGQCSPADFNAWILNFNAGC